VGVGRRVGNDGYGYEHDFASLSRCNIFRCSAVNGTNGGTPLNLLYLSFYCIPQHHPPLPHPITILPPDLFPPRHPNVSPSHYTMASTRTTNQPFSSSVFDALFSEAVAKYTQQTGKNLLDCPLASKIDGCDSAQSLLFIFHEQAQGFEEVRNGDPNLILWLWSMLNDLYTHLARTSLVSPSNRTVFLFVSSTSLFV